jgi:Arc/MetJ family transcription regulator
MTIRTTVSIDETLLKRAKKLAGTTSPSEVVNLGLAALIREATRHELLEWIEHGQLDISSSELERLRRRRGGRTR